MESSFQKIIAAVVGILILFIIPVYVAYEKVDDISYSLVLKMTQAFVDNVREKGYISPEMYNEYMSNIYSTNNSYDVQIEHLKKRYDPVIYIYDRVKGELKETLDYKKYIEFVEKGQPIVINKGIYNKYNASIYIEEPGIKLKDKDITEIEGYESYDERKLYEEKIDQYREQGRIILSKGKVYADVNVISDWDYDIYKPAQISTFDGSINIINAQGNEKRSLDYNTYIKKYDAKKSMMGPQGIGGEFFYGPTYNNTTHVPASFKVKGENVSAEGAKLLYDRWAAYYYQLVQSGKERIIFDTGEIYADKNKIEDIGDTKSYDDEIDIEANIGYTGSISIKNPNAWEPKEISFYDCEKDLKGGKIILYDAGGDYIATRQEGTIWLKNGQILKPDAYLQYEADMRDENKSSINMEIVETYDSNSINIENSKIIVTKTTYVMQDGEQSESKEYIEKDIETIDEYIGVQNQFINDNSVTIDGNTYSNNSSNESEESPYEIVRYDIEIKKPNVMILVGQLPSDRIVGNTDLIEQYISDYISKGNIVVVRTEEVEKDNINILYEGLSFNKGDKEITYYQYENYAQYNVYLNQYSQDNDRDGEIDRIITIEPLTYSIEDVNINYETISIKYTDGKEGAKEIIINSSDNKFNEFKNEFETTGKITIRQSNVIKLEDIEIQDAHIILKDTAGNTVIDIYEYNYQGKPDRNVNSWLFDIYYKDKEKNGNVTTLYNVNDVDVKRAYIKIEEYDTVEHAINATALGRISIETIYDNDPLYLSYRGEFENLATKGFVTANAAIVYKKNELTVSNPVVIIRNPDTGEIIEQYVPDYSKNNSDGRYWIYDAKRQQYENKYQIINEEQVTYTTDNYIIETGHAVNYERITDRQIVNKIFAGTSITKEQYLQDCMLGNFDSYSYLGYINDNSYILNEGDQIQVLVKNTNKTIASIFYGLFTANVGLDDVSKIYVNYGGTINNNGKTLVSDNNGTLNSEYGRIFKYKGYAETVTLEPGRYEIECWGASGGGKNNDGGKGGYVSAKYNVNETMNLYVYVGGAGAEYSESNEDNGGWNRRRQII